MPNDYSAEAFDEDAISALDSWEAEGRFIAFRIPDGFSFRRWREEDPLEELVSHAEVMSVVGDFLEMGTEVRALTH